MYNTRIAPSPTGDLHLGTARTAYFNWLAAKATGGKFILRIDDTDVDRNDESKVDDIFKIMDWLKLDYDILYRQSDHLDDYLAAAKRLMVYGLAQQLDDGAIVFKINDLGFASWHDEIAGDIAVGNQDLDYIKSMVLIKSDGYPTYNFASAFDDVALNVNYVIRGTDHIKNTAKQLALYTRYGIQFPKYAHVGLLTKDKKKLSKRDGAASMLAYKDAGINPDAMLNFMLRLGWGPAVDDKTTAVISQDKALEMFLNQGKMKASPANIDLQKLDSFDRKYKARLLGG